MTGIDGAWPAGRFCKLPGSVQHTPSGMVVVAGGAETERLLFMHLPSGFCAHFFANVGNVRQLRMAPGGELFAVSPTSETTGGGLLCKAAIVILPDDDKNRTA